MELHDDAILLPLTYFLHVKWNSDKIIPIVDPHSAPSRLRGAARGGW